ncbi:MAG: type I-E CRISPR-associated protein Cse1/CasA [Desulfovibrio desulfuricans]|nr:type I-E CRISPR-associated protein Cse1/CasA [Desulfovibrio desulfuricans]
MNLVSDQWIPVLDNSGQRQLVNLREALCEGAQWRDLAVRPHERVALMRLLLCIAHAALNGPSREDWSRVPQLLPDAVAAYLQKWQDSFDLFHPQKPFLQISGLKAASKKTKRTEDDEGPLVKASKLDFTLATGNQSTHFDHEGSLAQRSAEQALPALNLLSYLCFSPGGLIGTVVWNNHVTARSSSDGPCAVGSMTHTFWRGANVLQTLHLNMCARDDIERRLASIPEAGWGKPVWEQMPVSFDDANAWRNATHTYLGRLTPLSRLVLFQRGASGMTLGAGPVFPNFNNAKAPYVEEPTSTIILRGKDNKQTRALLPVTPGKALWRELHALVAHRNKDDVGGFWAAALASAEGASGRDMVVAGMARDQAEVVDTLESVYHIPQAMQKTPGQLVYGQGVQYAEDMSRKLGWAVDTYREKVDGGWAGRLKGAGAGKVELLIKLRQKAFTLYWTAAEQSLPLLFACVESLGSDAFPVAQKAWQKALFVAARKAYSSICAPQTPRQHRAFALGLARLCKPVATAASPNMASEISSDTFHEEDDE